MRSKIVETQLKKCSYADLSHFDNTTGVFNIPKYSKPKFDVGKMIYVDSLVFNIDTKSDTNIIWSGWLPTEQITQIATF